LDLTSIRQHDTAVMVVGPSGPNAERVTAALEQARVKVVRVGSAPVACEKLAAAMPQVVILVAPPLARLRADLADRAEAVGAIVMDVDERLEGDAYEDIVNEIITTAITRKMERDEVEPRSRPAGTSAPPSAGANGAVTMPPQDGGSVTASDPPTVIAIADAVTLDDSAVVDDGWDDKA
jgi:hypothetical protein